MRSSRPFACRPNGRPRQGAYSTQARRPAARHHGSPFVTTRTILFDSARFITSVAEPAQLNGAELAMLPEIAFVGRSNAGKSSVINVLTRQKQLAYASKTPGRTQLLNFFELSAKSTDGERNACGFLVDLPGYGFARVDEATRERWDALVGGFLQTRRMLAGVVLVMDARRPLTATDEALLEWLRSRERPEELRLHLLLNKADQLKTVARRNAVGLAEACADLLPMPTSVQLFSALKQEGVEELAATLQDIFDARV